MTVKFLDLTGTQYLVNKIKGEIPTTAEINTLINTQLATYKQGIVTIVTELPTTGEEGKLYLVPDANASNNNVYTTWSWESVQGTPTWVQMGATTFTLTVDSSLSTTSENPVQNKVIKSALDGKANASHTHGSITNDGKLGTASRVVITGTDKKIGISTVTTTELGYLSGVTSAIQTQINSKANSSHTHTTSEITDFPTIGDGTLTIQKNGTAVATFKANATGNATANIVVPTKISDLTDDSSFVEDSDLVAITNSEIDGIFTAS
jgi:hypothetical protein